MARKKIDKPLAYAWVAYMMTHQPEEMKHLLKYKTPSSNLIRLSEQPVGMTLSNGKFKVFTFPESLNKSAGQKLLFDSAVALNVYLKTIPLQAHTLLEHVRTHVTHRRKDTQANLHMVAEALCHRAASEFKHEILFAFDSINTWIKAAFGKELGYLTIRKCLELLQEAGIIRINEWGKRGNRSKCTKIELITDTKELILTYTSTVDAWLDSYAHAMMKVYARESITRQDVLEERIHHYADELANEAVDGPAWPPLRGLFGPVDDTMVQAETSSAPMTLEELLYELHIDRFLGELVQPVREDDTASRKNSRKLSEYLAIQNRGGP